MTQPPLPVLPTLVGHRGFPLHYPENTMSSLQAALDAGARMVECDVQMTRDGQFAVIHDADLARTSSSDGSVFENDLATLQQCSVHEPQRFAERFVPEPVPSLQQVIDRIKTAPDTELLVEVKQESIDRWGLSEVMQPLLELLEPSAAHCLVISFNAEAIDFTRRHSKLRTGWVLDGYTSAHQQRAQTLQPGMLIINQRRVADETELWRGAWQWMLYGVETIELVKKYAQRGVAYVETDDIGGLIAAVDAG